MRIANHIERLNFHTDPLDRIFISLLLVSLLKLNFLYFFIIPLLWTKYSRHFNDISLYKIFYYFRKKKIYIYIKLPKYTLVFFIVWVAAFKFSELAAVIWTDLSFRFTLITQLQLEHRLIHHRTGILTRTACVCRTV